MAIVYLSPVGNAFQFFTSGGLVLNGGFLYTYAAGSTTPTATYTTNIGNVQNANPIQLNSDGRCPSEIWLIAGQAYKFELTDSLLNSIATYDNLYGIGDPSAPVSADANAAALGFIPVTSVAGTANAITGSIPATVSAYAARQVFRLIPGTQNTGPTAIVLTPSGSSALTSRNIFLNGVALVGGELRAGIPVLLEDDGTQLNLISNGYLVAGTSGASITSSATVNLDNSTGDYVQILGSTLITAVTLAAGRERTIEFASTPAISSNPSLILPGGTTITANTGDTAIFRGETGGVVRNILYQRANGYSVNALSQMFIAGLTYANNVADATNDIDIAAGSARDASNSIDMVLASTLTKQSDVTWAVGSGNGGLDTGSVGNSDYYIWLIKRGDTGVVDALYSLSSTAPTMPANYTFKRLIGWIKRTGGAIVAFRTYETEGGGIEYNWNVPTLDINLGNTLTTARRTDAVRVPLNFSTIAHLNVRVQDAATAVVYICCPDQTDAAVDGVNAPLANIFNEVAGVSQLLGMRIRTSATGTIAARSDTATVDTYSVVTNGFTWARRN